MHVLSCARLQNDVPDATSPLSCVLFDRLSACKFGGNVDGSGFMSALLSRCSSIIELNPERSPGRLPASAVEERSLMVDVSR